MPVQIVVAAVNNPPSINGPSTITAVEDVPISFFDISISDPDQFDFGFNDPRIVTVGRTTITKGFEVKFVLGFAAVCAVRNFSSCFLR